MPAAGGLHPSFFEKRRRRVEMVLIEGEMCRQRVGNALLFLEKRRRRAETELIEGEMCRQRVATVLPDGQKDCLHNAMRFAQF